MVWKKLAVGNIHEKKSVVKIFVLASYKLFEGLATHQNCVPDYIISPRLHWDYTKFTQGLHIFKFKNIDYMIDYWRSRDNLLQITDLYKAKSRLQITKITGITG